MSDSKDSIEIVNQSSTLELEKGSETANSETSFKHPASHNSEGNFNMENLCLHKKSKFQDADGRKMFATGIKEMLSSLNTIFEDKIFMDAFDEEISAMFPKYKESLNDIGENMSGTDLKIMIAGDNCSGKTTLVNYLIGNEIFETPIYISTKVMFRISHSTDRKIVIYKEDKPDTEYFSSSDSLSERLQELSTDSEECDFLISAVDIHVPLSNVRKDIMLVDTPSTNEEERVSELINDFAQLLPDALAILFTIDVSRAGGFEGMLNTLLESVALKIGEMEWFDPSSAIFVTTKWEHISEQTSYSNPQSSGDLQSEKEKTWSAIVENLQREWPFVAMENVFRFTLADICKANDEPGPEVKKFLDLLHQTVQINLERRFLKDLKILEKVLNQMENCILAKINKDADAASQKAHLKGIQKRFSEEKRQLQVRLEANIKRVSNNLHSYINSKAGQSEILKAVDISLLNAPFAIFRDEVVKTVVNGIHKWCTGPEVSNVIREIDEDIEMVVTKVDDDFRTFEHHMTGASDRKFIETDESKKKLGQIFASLAPNRTKNFLFNLLPAKAFLKHDYVLAKTLDYIYVQCLKVLKKAAIEAAFEHSIKFAYDQKIRKLFEEFERKVIGTQKMIDKKSVEAHVLERKGYLGALQGNIERLLSLKNEYFG